MAAVETAGLPRAHLRTVLLLLLADEPSHGYDMLEAARNVGMSTAEAAGVYRTLRSLEHDDLVTSWWEPSQVGPARRTYAITSTGTVALRVAMRDLDDQRRALDLLLARYRHLNGET